MQTSIKLSVLMAVAAITLGAAATLTLSTASSGTQQAANAPARTAAGVPAAQPAPALSEEALDPSWMRWSSLTGDGQAAERTGRRAPAHKPRKAPPNAKRWGRHAVLERGCAYPFPMRGESRPRFPTGEAAAKRCHQTEPQPSRPRVADGNEQSSERLVATAALANGPAKKSASRFFLVLAIVRVPCAAPDVAATCENWLTAISASN